MKMMFEKFSGAWMPLYS